MLSLYAGITINAQGFRGPERTPAKPPGQKRILCLGDSVTFGLEQPLSYASMLEEMLNSSSKENLSVINHYAAFTNNPHWEKDYMNDGTHPNDRGYAVMAKMWATAMEAQNGKARQ